MGNLGNNGERGLAEEVQSRRPRSTLERLWHLQAEMEVEEEEFVRSMEAGKRKTEELKIMNVELEKRLKAVKEEVSLVEAQLQILWEACRRMIRELDRGEEARRCHEEDGIQKTTRGTQRTRRGTLYDGGEAFSKGDKQQAVYKADAQCETPIEFAPRVCSSPMPSPIKHLPNNYGSASMEMESRLVSHDEGGIQNDPGNLNRSRMLVNFGPEMIAAKERVGFVRSERISPSNRTVDSMRKRRLADLSDPDLQIIDSRQRNIDSDFQVTSFFAHSCI